MFLTSKISLKSKGFFLLLFICANFCTAQTVVLDAKISKAKQGEKERLLKNIEQAFKQPIADSTYLQYESAFWAMMYLEHKPITALPKLKSALLNFTKYENEFQDALLEVIYSQYPKELEKEIAILINDTSITAKQFAVCGEYLSKISTARKYSTLKYLANFYKPEIYLDDSLNYYSVLYNNLLQTKIDEQILKNKSLLKKILINDFLPNKPIIISLQNKKRNFPGLAIIRKANGDLLKLKDSIFYVQQLTRSITNLPFYISNGNTPQGIFRIDGFGISKNSHIGPTENFQLCMPYECNVKDFFDEPILDSIWTDSIFNKILPKQMSLDYRFLLESTIAGKLGRYEIISHGSTVNPIFYKSKPYTGFTPTMGCLQAKEVWDYTTGKRIYSDQQKLIDAYKSIGAVKGYLIVLNIIDSNRPVTINDFKAIIK
jgi:hypothetical protein